MANDAEDKSAITGSGLRRDVDEKGYRGSGDRHEVKPPPNTGSASASQTQQAAVDSAKKTSSSTD